MTFLCLVFAMFQEQQVGFTPVHAGGVIQTGSFAIAVPDGCLYADQDNVQYMYGLAGASFIPNCIGMYFSGANDWTYSVTVQHYPFQNFTLEPSLEPEAFVEAFRNYHLYRHSPVNQPGEVVLPPSYNPDEGSFAMGMRYLDQQGKPGIFIKKVYVTGQDALLLSMQSSEAGYNEHLEEIEAIFQSISKTENNIPPPMEMAPISYLELLGMNASQESQAEGIPANIKIVSAGLVVFAVILMVVAIRILKKKKVPLPTDGTETTA